MTASMTTGAEVGKAGDAVAAEAGKEWRKVQQGAPLAPEEVHSYIVPYFTIHCYFCYL